MSTVEQQVKGSGSNATSLLDEAKLLSEVKDNKQGRRKAINSELWDACAGPLVSLPHPGSLVYYFPQGHSEQVSVSTRKSANLHIPNYPGLPSQLMCQVYDVTLHADRETDEICAQMTLQPLNSELDAFPIPDFGHTRSKHPSDFFCKTLTASDTSTHGGFSVPRRAAEKLFPPLDHSVQPPNQELIVRDLHDNLWTFRHIYRGQPKRHLLTTGWSSFVSTKRLKAGDSILFIRDAKSQLLLGIRRAQRQQTTMPSSVLSADSMHIGVLAAAAHATASCSPFTVFYNPRACPSEFIIPLARYHKTAYTRVSVGMRFGMMFETEESTKRRYMGTIIAISDYDPIRWPNSKWRNLQVEWDEHGYGERTDRVSVWEIETPENLFVYPPASSKRQCLPGFVMSGVGIGNTNTKPSFGAPEIGMLGLNPLVSGLESQHFMKLLLESQTMSSGQQLVLNQTTYPSISRCIGGNAMPTCLPTMSSSTTARSLLQDDADNKMLGHLDKKHLYSPLQKLPKQSTFSNQKPQCRVQQHGVNVDCASFVKEGPQQQLRVDSLLDFSCPDLVMEHRTAPGNENKKTLIHGRKFEKLDVTSDFAVKKADEHTQITVNSSYQACTVELPTQLPTGKSREETSGSSACEDFTSHPYQCREMEKEHDDSQSLQDQCEVDMAKSPKIENQSMGTLDKLMPQHGVRSNHVDHEPRASDSWGFQPISDSLGTSKCLSNSGMAQSVLVCVSDNTTSSSDDISTIVNEEHVKADKVFHFSRSSDTQNPHCFPASIEELLGCPELSCEEHADGFVRFQDVDNFLCVNTKLSGIKYSSVESNSHNDVHNNIDLGAWHDSVIMDSYFPNVTLENFGTLTGSNFNILSPCLFNNSSMNQDIQSQVTSPILVDPLIFSGQNIPDSFRDMSYGNIDTNEFVALSEVQTKQVSHPLRTYTKVQKQGSVGRSIDVTRFKSYDELKSAISSMFGLEGQLDDMNNSEWKLVYVDYENDVLLVGDDPWEEFVNCVRCIRILSPFEEVQQMSMEGIPLGQNHALHH